MSLAVEHFPSATVPLDFKLTLILCSGNTTNTSFSDHVVNVGQYGHITRCLSLDRSVLSEEIVSDFSLALTTGEQCLLRSIR